MDNQQATKNWFTGFLEGEGSFGFRLKRKAKEYRVRISNTQLDLIQACTQFLSTNMVRSYTSPIRKMKEHWTQAYELSVLGFQDCNILYHRIKDVMECRHQELQSILGASTTTRETSADLGWLIGLLEAEGHFTITTQNMKNGYVAYRPRVSMVNTNFDIVSKMTKTLHSLGLSWYVQGRTPLNPLHKPSKSIDIIGCKRCVRFLKATKGLWIGDKTIGRTDLMLKFCESRLSKQSKAVYTEEEHGYALQIRVNR